MENIETNVVKPKIQFILNEQTISLLDKEIEVKLDSKIDEIKQFISNNNGKGLSNSEKDELYLSSQKIWKEFISDLEKTKYNFYLNKSQHKFLVDLVMNKLEYDVNSVFFAIELKELFGALKSVKYKNDNEVVSYPVNATEITYIYHLISKYKVKGLTQDSYLFAEILMKIGDISKIFNYYDATGKNLASDIQDWVVTFEDGVTKEEVVQGQVI